MTSPENPTLPKSGIVFGCSEKRNAEDRSPSGPGSRSFHPHSGFFRGLRTGLSTESPVVRNKGRQMCYPLPKPQAVFPQPFPTSPGRRERQREWQLGRKCSGRRPFHPDRIRIGSPNIRRPSGRSGRPAARIATVLITADGYGPAIVREGSGEVGSYRTGCPENGLPPSAIVSPETPIKTF